MLKQSSSTTVKIMKKSKPTARHPISKYLTTTGTTRESGAATRQHLLSNQSSRRLILLTRKFTQNASCTPKESTRVSNASSFAKHSEHLHLLPTKTTRKRANMSKISFDNQRRRSQSDGLNLLRANPPVLYPIKARMGPPELRFYPRTTRSQRRRSTPHKVVGWV